MLTWTLINSFITLGAWYGTGNRHLMSYDVIWCHRCLYCESNWSTPLDKSPQVKHEYVYCTHNPTHTSIHHLLPNFQSSKGRMTGVFLEYMRRVLLTAPHVCWRENKPPKLWNFTPPSTHVRVVLAIPCAVNYYIIILSCTKFCNVRSYLNF